MSRKNQKKEEESQGAKILGGIAVGVAVAAAGAAIGYFGRQLYNALQTTQETEGATGGTHNESCAEKLARDDDLDYKETSGRRRLDRKSFSGADSSGSSTKELKDTPKASNKQPSVSLHDQLMNYYHDYADVPPKLLADADKVVNGIRLIASRYLRDPKSLKLPMLKIGDLSVFGSTAENLAVVRPDSYDLIVPIALQTECQAKNIVSGSALEPAGLFHLEIQHGGDSSSCCDALLNSGRHLLSDRLADVLLAPFQQVCNEMPYVATVASRNSLIAMSVMRPSGQHWLSINFVPAVILGNKLFLKNCISSNNVDCSQWQTCYARQEQWSIDRFDSSVRGHYIAVKILKAIRLNHLQQFGLVSSYHIKNVLYHVLDDLPDSSDWHETAVSERLIDLLLRLMHALNDHCLPQYFEQSVNLFSSIPEDECVKLAKFIEKKLGHNDIASLLEKHY